MAINNNVTTTVAVAFNKWVNGSAVAPEISTTGRAPGPLAGDGAGPRGLTLSLEGGGVEGF